MAKNRNPQTRDLVVACCANLVGSHSERLKSGWQNLFSVWTLAASRHFSGFLEECLILADDSQIDIVESAFNTAQQVVAEQFKTDFLSALDAFPVSHL